MSAKQVFAFCIDCWELHYGNPDSNGVYQRDSGSSNHHGHAVHVFGPPEQYSPPIRGVLTHLLAGLPVSDGRIDMFSLALAVEAIQPNNGVKVAGVDVPDVDTLPSGAEPLAAAVELTLFGQIGGAS